MLYNNFSSTKLWKYACRNIILTIAVLGLCTLMLGPEQIQAASARKNATFLYPHSGQLTAIKQNNMVVIDEQKYRLHKRARITKDTGSSVAIHKLSLPLYVDFECDRKNEVAEGVIPTIIALKVITKTPL